ncbi:MAG: flagellar hook-basal body protein [Chloroflexota bacterium]
MIRGLYTSASGLVDMQARMDQLSGNIANVSTVGFKEILDTSEDYGANVGLAMGDGGSVAGLGRLSYGSVATGAMINRRQGPLINTTKSTDLAIAGDGLFVVGTPDGIAYTRAGDFVLDANGMLVTQQGYPVLDTNGRTVTVPGGASTFAVSPDGTIAGTGQRLAFISFPATGVGVLGENLFSITGPVQPVAAGSGSIQQGYLEGSNVDLSGSMTELIALQRMFQLSARSLSLQDQTLEDANNIGKLK